MKRVLIWVRFWCLLLSLMLGSSCLPLGNLHLDVDSGLACFSDPSWVSPLSGMW